VTNKRTQVTNKRTRKRDVEVAAKLTSEQEELYVRAMRHLTWAQNGKGPHGPDWRSNVSFAYDDLEALYFEMTPYSFVHGQEKRRGQVAARLKRKEGPRRGAKADQRMATRRAVRTKTN
jgi:hypothetical protein